MHTFRYNNDAINHLKKRDKKLGNAIDEIGLIEREVIPNIFIALVSTVASQQISAKAAETIWGRMVDRFGAITPETISSAATDDLQQCGLSMRKTGYIKGIADAVAAGSLDLDRLHNLPDDEIITLLTNLKGVGIWTAEMILILSMERPDVLSWGDLAIRRGMIRLYEKEIIDRAGFEYHRKRYSPYGSVASLYLWEISHR